MDAKFTIKDIKPYNVPLFDETGYLKLDSNESDFGPSPRVIESLRNVTAEDIKFYPFYGELIEKIAGFHNVSSKNITVTAGADEALSAIFSTFLEMGQSVLTVTPSFVMPKIYSKINGLVYNEIPYSKKWEFPTDEFITEIKNNDFIHITTPNSPTGEIISEQIIKNIIEVAKEKPILIDETYSNYSGVTNLSHLEGRDNIFIVRSFSKDFALAGLRLGYVISSEENIKELRKYLSPYNVSTITAKAGIAALSDIEYFEEVKLEMEESKKLLKEELEKLGAKVYPSKTNFICADFEEKADFIYKTLLKNKIKVKYFEQTPMLENCFRIAIPTLKNVQKVINALEVKPTIVFDMDGVLIDASKSYREAVRRTFNDLTQKEVSHEEISATKKLGGLNNDWDLTEFLLKKYGYEFEYEKIVDIFQGHYGELAQIEQPLVNREFFEELKEGFNLAIFTGRVKEEAYYTLDKHGFTDYFHPIITMAEVGMECQKPHTKGIDLIKEQILTQEIYYLGDTVDDMMCAKNAGVEGIGVLPPQDKSEELKELLTQHSASVVLDEVTKLIDYIKVKI